MNFTNYISPLAFSKKTNQLIGGIFQWWYCPIEWLNGFPFLNASQQLPQPSLKSGRNWLTSGELPLYSSGYEQSATTTDAGTLFKRKVSAFEPGLDFSSFINVANLVANQFCFVGLVTAGQCYIIIGNNKAGLKIDPNTSTGVGPIGMPGTKLGLADESSTPALVLTSFNP